MILPTKRVSQDRALLSVGADVLDLLEEPKTVSLLWDEFQGARVRTRGAKPLTYDWFVLALDFLYALQAIDLERGRIRKVASDTPRI